MVRQPILRIFLLLLLATVFSDAMAAQPEYLPPKGLAGTTRHITLIARSLPGSPPFDLSFNGTIPGPTIIINEGDEVLLTLVNSLSEPVSIHVHGVHYAIKSDGTFHTASFAPPGGTYTYHWVAGPGTAGTWHYHDHVVGNKDVGSAERGLFGALIVRPPGGEPPNAEAVVLLVNEGVFGSIIRNGKETTLGSRPTFEVSFADRMRFHLVSEGTLFHNFRIGGHNWVDPATGRIVDKKLIGAAETYPFDIRAGWSHGAGDWSYSSEMLDPSNTLHGVAKGILRVKPSLLAEPLGRARIGMIDLPRTQFNLSETFSMKVDVDYALPAPTTVRLDLIDQEVGRLIVSENRTLFGKGVARFQFQLTTPSVEKPWRLRAEVRYLVGGAWRSDAERSQEELIITTGSAERPQEVTPTQPERAPAPLLPSSLILLAAALAATGVLGAVTFLRRRRLPAALLLLPIILTSLGSDPLLEDTRQDPFSARATPSSGSRSLTLAAQETALHPLNWAFNNSVPGPTILASTGDTVSLTIVNRLPVGLRFQILRGLADDGLRVAVNISQPVPVGGSLTIAWDVKPSMNGTWYYRDEANADRGLFGAIIVRAAETPADREFVIFMVGFEFHGNMLHKSGELALGVNPTLEAKLGSRVRFHVITEGKLLHTFHIHAHRWLDPGTTRIIDTKTIRASQIHVFEVIAGDGVGPGDWMYHCHVVEHMQFGMIGIFRVS